MLSIVPNWNWLLSSLIVISVESRNGIRSILKELQKHHYLEIEKIREKWLF